MQKFSFDYLLDQYIGFGKYQWNTFMNSSALSCNYGNLALLLSLLLKLYHQELDITMNKGWKCFGRPLCYEVQQYYWKNQNYQIFSIDRVKNSSYLYQLLHNWLHQQLNNIFFQYLYFCSKDFNMGFVVNIVNC